MNIFKSSSSSSRILEIACILFIQSFTISAQSLILKSEGLNLTLSTKGQLIALTDPASQKNYLAVGEKAPLLQIRIGNDWYEPTGATFKSGMITILYQPANVTA
jgi:hypothetical protein